MRYTKEAEELSLYIKKSSSVVINVHKTPDLDSIGSALTMAVAVEHFGKKAIVVCPQEIPEHYNAIYGIDRIVAIDYSKYDFKQHDLFIVMDSSNPDRVTGAKNISLPNITTLVIDHHQANSIEGKMNLVDTDASATAQIVLELFKTWKIQLNSQIATWLYGGLMTDTDFLKYTHNAVWAYETAAELIKEGADKDYLLINYINNHSFSFIKLIGKFLEYMQLDTEHKFVWTAIPYSIFKEYDSHDRAREFIADEFSQSLHGMNIGITMLEEEPGKLRVSLRSVSGMDVSKIARELGGGGHRDRAGCLLTGNFTELVQKVLGTTERIIKEHNHSIF